jgi:hypothetical protein
MARFAALVRPGALSLSMVLCVKKGCSSFPVLLSAGAYLSVLARSGACVQ